ncbi:MAG: phosphoribosylanthranilate isomerase, partial [Dehalococcoidia bacterium]|nr:phosphoribosylanthranilate isomerase [Dehalococcoidia bacterium]
ARLRADLLGLVFAPSPRRVSPEQAREIADALAGAFPMAHSDGGTGVSPVRTGQRPGPPGGQPVPDTPHLSVGYRSNLTPSQQAERGTGGEVLMPLLVGVFVNQALDEVNGAAAHCGLDYIQLSGDETPEYCRGLARPLIKALRLVSGDKEDEIARRIDSYLEVAPGTLFLLDTHMPGVYGGTGRTWEWERAALLAQRYHILVAGGLTPENVAPAVRATRPWGVDVSSGVETNGTKDETKIREFIEAVRNCESKNGD